MFRRNVAVTGFSFGFVSSVDGTPVLSGSPVGFITKDGGAQASLTNALTHLGNGQWVVNLTQTEMNADMIGLAFILSGAVPVYFTIRTVPEVGALADINAVSGSTTRALNFGAGTDTEVRGTIQGGSTASSFVTDLTPTTTNYYVGRSIAFRTGNLIGQAMPIIAYNGTTKAVTVTNPTNLVPGSGDTFVIL